MLAQLGARKAAIRVAGWLSLLLRQRGALEALRAAERR
jgi:hypothetical protein